MLRGINLYATKLSKDAQLLLFDIFVIHNFLTSSGIALRRSDVAVLKHDETIILSHPFTSSPDGPEPPFIFIAAFFIRSSSMSSYIFYIGPCSIACWEVSFASGCFNSNNLSTSSIARKIQPLILYVNILGAPLTFPFCI